MKPTIQLLGIGLVFKLIPRMNDSSRSPLGKESLSPYSLLPIPYYQTFAKVNFLLESYDNETQTMPNLKEDDNAMRDVLTDAKVIAVVGHSDKPERTSYRIAQFLREVGYKVYPVNPVVSEIDGQPSYASLKDIPDSVDIVNVFRRSEYLPAIVDEAIAVNAKTVWAQLGVYDQPSAHKALDAGLNVVMDACIKVEYMRLRVG